MISRLFLSLFSWVTDKNSIHRQGNTNAGKVAFFQKRKHWWDILFFCYSITRVSTKKSCLGDNHHRHNHEWVNRIFIQGYVSLCDHHKAFMSSQSNGLWEEGLSFPSFRNDHQGSDNEYHVFSGSIFLDSQRLRKRVKETLVIDTQLFFFGGEESSLILGFLHRWQEVKEGNEKSQWFQEPKLVSISPSLLSWFPFFASSPPSQLPLPND